MTQGLLDDHFHNPRNAGPMDRPDIDVQAENPVCGDLLRLYLRLEGGGRVEAARFQAYGCPAAIAAGSVLTELLVGRGAEALGALDEAAIAAALGGLGGESAHAGVLAADLVRAARAAFPSPAGSPKGKGKGSGKGKR